MINDIERERQNIQVELDAMKTQEARNVMGQFSTPNKLALEVLLHARMIFPKREKVKFLDPAFGTGSFFSALNTVFPEKSIESALGIEVDPHYAVPSKELWKQSILDYQLADFTEISPPSEDEKVNLLICNPPYVRHHHIVGKKEILQRLAKQASNMELSSLAGLYCYFMALAHPWMAENGVAGWLIPSEFMDVNYGDAVKKYLLEEVTLLQIHRYDPNNVQFDDALVSSAVVWIKNKKPPKNHKVRFSYGGTLDEPAVEKNIASSALWNEKKWTRFPLNKVRKNDVNLKISDFFTVKRGIATGDNKFFVLNRTQIEEKGLPLEQFRPILPSPRYLKESYIERDEVGYPMIDNQLFVLDSKIPLTEVESKYPALFEYLQHGIELGVSERYLCKNRKIWYSQENRQESRFYCTYIGRSNAEGRKPFRFILNNSDAIVANSYLILYPLPNLQAALNNCSALHEMVIDALNNITVNELLDEGRVYGGGMHKMEPKELANVPAQAIAELIELNSIGVTKSKVLN